MKNYILLLLMMMTAGMVSGQFKVTADGVNHALNGGLIVGENAGSVDARIKIGQNRTADGNAYIDLVSDQSNFGGFGTRLIRFASGLGKFDHRGAERFDFNAADGANFYYRISGSDRVQFTPGAILSGIDGGIDIGSSTKRFQDVYATNGVVQTSDKRLKKNIKKTKYGLKEILQLNAVEFEWKDSDLNPGVKLGFIAQDLQKVIKEVVKESDIVPVADGFEKSKNVSVDNEMMGVYYTDLIPVLVSAMQEQQEIIESQNRKIESLTNEIKNINQSLNIQGGHNERGISDLVLSDPNTESMISQNSPNPSKGETIIGYSISPDFGKAEIQFYNLSGKLLKTEKITESGKGQLRVNSQDMPSSTVTYVLVVDGKIIDTKKMGVIR